MAGINDKLPPELKNSTESPDVESSLDNVSFNDAIFGGDSSYDAEVPDGFRVQDPESINTMANKQHFALGEDSPGVESLKHDIYTGGEKGRREDLLAKEKYNQTIQKQNLIQNYVFNSEGPVDPDQILALSQMYDRKTAELTSDPETFYEKKYGQSIVMAVANGSYEAAIAEDPGKTDLAMEVAQRSIARQQALQPIADAINEKWQESNSFQTAYEYSRFMLPAASWWNTQNRVGGGVTSSLLQGSNFREQAEYLHSLPPKEAADVLRRAVNDIASNSVLDAQIFANDMVAYNTSWEGIDNIFSVIDAADIGLTAGGSRLIKGAAKLGKASKTAEFSERLKRTIKAANDWNPDSLFIADAAGLKTESTIMGAQKVALDRAAGVAPAKTWEEIVHYLPTFMNLKDIVSGVSNKFSREASLRIADALQQSADSLAHAFINDPININRLADNEVKAALAETQKKFELQYPTASGAINDVSVLHDAVTNTMLAEMRLGLPSGRGFSSEEMADFFAEDMWELGNWEIEEYAGEFFVKTQKAIDETSDSVRSVMDINTLNRTPGAYANRWIGYLRGAKTKVGKDAGMGFDTIRVGETALEQIAQESLKEVSKLSNKSIDKLEKFIVSDRDYVHPKTGVRGRYADDLGEFQERWMTLNDNQLPTENEALAYFKYRQLNDLHFAVYNHGIYRTKVRKGIEQHSFDIPGIKMKKPHIEGKILADGLPYNSPKNAGVLIVAPDGIKKTTLRQIRKDSTLEKFIQSKDYQVIQVTPTGRKTLLGYADTIGLPKNSHFQYVVVRKVKSKPLQYQQIPYRAGGNVETKDGFRIVQPQIRRVVNEDGSVTHFYEGDRSVWTVNLRAKGKKFLDKLEKVRQAAASGLDDVSLAALLKKELPVVDMRRFKAMFNDKDGLDINQELFVVPTNTSAERAHNLATRYDNFVSPKDDPHNLYNDVDLAYAQERGQSLQSIADEGTVDNPIFKFEESEKVSPLNMLNKTLDHMISVKHTKDLAIKEAELWVSEFHDVIKADGKTLEQLRANPVATLMNHEVSFDVDNTQRAAAAKSAQVALREQLRLKDPEQKTFERIVGNMLDKIYNSRNIGGPRIVESLEPWTLGLAKLGSPSNAFRYSAFIGHMGLFSPVQLFLQSQGWVHIASLEGPGRATLASFAGQYMLRLGYMTDPEALKLAAKRAKTFGWKEKDFIESYEGLRRTGFSRIGRETATLTDTSVAQATVGNVKKTLDKTAVLFRMGERFVRTTAWNAAYQGWRQANPTAVFNDAAIAKVLQRADTLSVNMTSASNAAWQQGIASVPTQFFSFQARLTDQMLDFGSNAQLTTKEKAQLMLGYSIAYGAPAGVFGTSLGLVWPIHEEISTYLRENGYNTDENIVTHVLDKGVQQVFAGMLTGTDPSVSDRFAPGFSITKEVYKGDKDFLEILAGPGGSFWAKAVQNTLPLASTILSVGQENNPNWAVLQHDLHDVASTVTSYNTVTKALFAYNTGRVITKHSRSDVVSDVTPMEATYMILGIQPQRIVDSWLLMEDNKEVREAKRVMNNDAVKFFRLGHEAESPEDKLAFYRRANTLLQGAGNDPTQLMGVITESFKGYEGTLEKHEAEFVKRIKDNPAVLDSWLRKLERREGRTN